MPINHLGTSIVQDSGNTGSVSTVTIPTGATYCIIGAAWWDNDGSGFIDMTGTLDGQTVETVLVNPSGYDVECAALFVCRGFSSGSGKTFTWDWTGTGNDASEGCTFTFEWKSGVDLSGANALAAVRDYGYATEGGSDTEISVTVDSESTDIVTGVGCSYGGAGPTFSNHGQTQTLGPDEYSSARYGTGYITGSATSTTLYATIENGEMIAASIMEETATETSDTPDTGTFFSVGLDINVIKTSTDSLNSGSYSYSGLDVSSIKISSDSSLLDSGLYSYSGLDISSIRTRIDALTTGSYSYSGSSVTATYFTSSESEIPNAETPLVNVTHPDDTYSGYSVSGHWTVANSPYLISGDIIVENGNSLIIDPGVQIIFQDTYSFRIFGSVYAVGTPSNPIVFTTTSEDIALGASWVGWKGIRIVGADYNDTAIAHGTGVYNFQYCEISYVDKNYGETGHPWEDFDGAFYAHGCHYEDLVFDNNYVHHSRSIGIAYYGGQNEDAYLTDEPYFYNNVFEYMYGYGAISVDHVYTPPTGGSHRPVHFVGGAARHHQGTVNLFSVAFAWDADLYIDGLEIVDSGVREIAPWFETDGGGSIYYTPPDNILGTGTYSYNLSNISSLLSRLDSLNYLDYSYSGLSFNSSIEYIDNINLGTYSYSGLDTIGIHSHIDNIANGSYSYSGLDIDSLVSLHDNLNYLSYSFNGLDLDIFNNYSDILNQLSYSYSGLDINSYHSYSDILTNGSFSYGLLNINQLFNYNSNIENGSYSYSGTDLDVLLSRIDQLTKLDYSFIGLNVNTNYQQVNETIDNLSILSYNFSLSDLDAFTHQLDSLSLLSYSLIGKDIDSTYNKVDILEGLPFIYIASSINAYHNYFTNLNIGDFTYILNDINIVHNYTDLSLGGDYSYIGLDLNSYIDYISLASTLVYSYEGLNLPTNYQQENVTRDNLSSGSYSLSGIDIVSIKTYIDNINIISYTYVGLDLDLIKSIVSTLSTLDYSFIGQPINSFRDYIDSLSNLDFSLSLLNLNAILSLLNKLDSGQYQYIGIDIEAKKTIISSLDFGIYSYLGKDISNLFNLVDTIEYAQYNYNLSNINSIIWSNSNFLEIGIYNYTLSNLHIINGVESWENILDLLGVDSNNITKINNIDKENISYILDVLVGS